jgi:hypothetical protein
MKTLSDIIKNREPISNFQENMLISLLSKGCREEAKRRIKSIVKYSFYSSFEGKWFAKKILMSENEINFIAGQDMTEELRSIRKELLK